MKAIINIKNYVRAFPKLQWEGEDETFQYAITIFGLITIDNFSSDKAILLSPDNEKLGEYDIIEDAQDDAELWYHKELVKLFDKQLSDYNRNNKKHQIYYSE